MIESVSGWDLGYETVLAEHEGFVVRGDLHEWHYPKVVYQELRHQPADTPHIRESRYKLDAFPFWFAKLLDLQNVIDQSPISYLSCPEIEGDGEGHRSRSRIGSCR